MEITEQRKKIVKCIVDNLGGQPKFLRVWDYVKRNSIDMLCLEDAVDKDLNFYSTIGTAEYPSGFSAEGVPISVELFGVCDDQEKVFVNILATCSFYISNSHYKCYPGAIYHNVIDRYLPDIEMKHIMFVLPFLWEDKLKIIDLDDRKVTWLLVIPISEQEAIYAEKNGVNALEDLFHKEEIDIFNIYRRSVN